MDNYLDKKCFINYYSALAKIEATNLINFSEYLAQRHIKNGSIRKDFKNDIGNFIEIQMNAIMSSDNEKNAKIALTT